VVGIKVYHISRSKNRESILKDGLIPHEKNWGRIQYAPSIFLSTDPNNLGFDYVDYENVDCWEFEVDGSQIKKDPFSGSTSHYYISEAIPADKLTLLPNLSLSY
jgi:hypothetical protein